MFLFNVPYSKKASYQSANLREPIMLGLHSIYIKVLIPRARDSGTVRIMGMVLIYLMKKNIKINLPIIIIDHIMHCCSYFYHVVSYGSIITILLEKKKIPLNRETMPIKVFTKKILGHKGLDVSSDMLRFKEFGVLAEKKKPDKKKRKIGGTNIDAAVIERLDTLENTLDKMYKLIEGMSKSYASKVIELEKKLVEIELLVLCLPEDSTFCC